MTDVVFVQMPFGSIARPSLGLSILKSSLIEAGISCRIEHANFTYAERLGLELTMFIEIYGVATMMGDWLFGRAAFPDYRGDDEGFLRRASMMLGQEIISDFERVHGGKMVEVLDAAREDACVFVRAIAESLANEHPKVVGCTTLFQQNVPSIALLRALKAIDPTIATMMGGPNCSDSMGESMHRNFPWIDYIATGESDRIIVDLVRHAFSRRDGAQPTVGPRKSLLSHGDANEGLPPGVVGPPHRRAGADLSTVSGRVFENLDESPIPVFDDYFARLATSPLKGFVHPTLPIETSRGCWWGEVKHCTFCGLNGTTMRYRAKSADRALAELETLCKRHQLHRFAVSDNILSTDYFKDVLPALRDKNAPYTFFYEIVPMFKKPQIELLREAGVRVVQPGIESLSDEVLGLLRKGNSVAQNLQVLRWATTRGIIASWNVLLDVKDEKDAWYEEPAGWIPLLTHLQAPQGITPIIYERFSPYFEQRDAFGLTLTPTRGYSAIYPLRDQELFDLACVFDVEDTTFAEKQLEYPARRPHLYAFMMHVERWRQLSSSRYPPVLIATELDGAYKIQDTREIAPSFEQQVTGLSFHVYKLCDVAQRTEGLEKALRAQGIPFREEALARALEELVERKLMIRASGRWVTLATFGRPEKPLPTSELPIGSIDLQGYRLAQQTTSLPTQEERLQGAADSVSGIDYGSLRSLLRLFDQKDDTEEI